jgi:ankyrin repeat protein
MAWDPRSFGMLPIHIACMRCNKEAAKYSLSIHPESINVLDIDRKYPLRHLLNNFVDHRSSDYEDFIWFLLQHDQGAVSKPMSNGKYALHIVSESFPLSIIELMYNAHPQAIHARDNRECTPFNYVCLHSLTLKWSDFSCFNLTQSNKLAS